MPQQQPHYLGTSKLQALLQRDGPTRDALIPGPIFRGMAAGQLVRFERWPHLVVTRMCMGRDAGRCTECALGAGPGGVQR